MLIKIDKMNVPDSLSKIDLLIFPIYIQSIESQLPGSPEFISCNMNRDTRMYLVGLADRLLRVIHLISDNVDYVS